MKTPPYPSTPWQARAWFDANGIAITDWCNAFGLDRLIVTDILRGRLKGIRGESHRAAVLLGIKADPDAVRKLAA
jgi:gp16 family phage-associated protein